MNQNYANHLIFGVEYLHIIMNHYIYILMLGYYLKYVYEITIFINGGSDNG